MSLLDTIAVHRNEILSIAARHGIDNIRLFGSVLRREETEDSDIDFLIHVQPGRSAFDLIHFKRDTSQLLGRDCDVITDHMLHWYIRDKVLQEAKPL